MEESTSSDEGPPELNRVEIYDRLVNLYSLYSNIQVQADTVYHNRTSIITLTQGLLLVAYQATVGKTETQSPSLVIAVTGFLVAFMWIFFEQRNLIFFQGRNAILETLEKELKKRKISADTEFFGFWTEVPLWVNSNAVWYQKFSAQLILRFFIPLVFCGAWLVLATNSALHFLPTDNTIMQLERMNSDAQAESPEELDSG